MEPKQLDLRKRVIAACYAAITAVMSFYILLILMDVLVFHWALFALLIGFGIMTGIIVGAKSPATGIWAGILGAFWFLCEALAALVTAITAALAAVLSGL